MKWEKDEVMGGADVKEGLGFSFFHEVFSRVLVFSEMQREFEEGNDGCGSLVLG